MEHRRPEPGGDAVARAVARLQAGEPLSYRGMTLHLHGAAFDVRVPLVPAPSAAPPVPQPPLTAHRALDLLTRARYRLGALLASVPPLEATVGNRAPRLVLVRDASADAGEVYELRGDRLRRLG